MNGLSKLRRGPVVLLAIFLMNICFASIGFAESRSNTDVNPGFSFGELLDNARLAKEFCSVQTLRGLVSGKIILTDEMVNEWLLSKNARGAGGSSLEDLRIGFKEDNQIAFRAKSPKWGDVEAKGLIEEIRYDKSGGIVKVKLTDKEIKDNGLNSWLVSTFSLGFVNAILGPVDFGENMKTKIWGNTVTVDFREYLTKAPIGKVEFAGVKFIDCFKITGVKTFDGYAEFDTGLELPEQLRSMVLTAIKSML